MALRHFTIDTPDGAMSVHECRNKVRDRAAVIVLHEALGATDHLLDIVSRLGAVGYHAVAPELYHRGGVTTIAEGDYDAIYAQLAAVDDTTFLVDLDATIGYLIGAGFRPPGIGAVGFNIGARVSFLLALSRTIGAAVGFYGSGIVTAPSRLAARLPSLIERASELRTPWLGLYGEQDHTVPLADIEQLEAALAGHDAAVIRYPDAGHAFHSDARPQYYVAPAARDAWRCTLEWFESRLALVGP
jgi:carboxymethylenebutenolidase